MFYKQHVMVVVQLVMHLFLHQACFVPNFEHVMSEQLFFQKNVNQSLFGIKGSMLLILKNVFTHIVSEKSDIRWLAFAVGAARCLNSEKVKCFQHARRRIKSISLISKNNSEP